MAEDPEAEARRVVEELRPAFTALIGESAFESLFGQGSIDLRLFLDSPRTWQARLHEQIQEGIRSGQGDAAERMLAFLPDLMAVTADLRAQRTKTDGRLVSGSPGCSALAELAAEAVREAGAPAVRSLIPDTGDLLQLLGSYGGLGDILNRGLADAGSVTFEEHVGTLTSHLHHASERYYRPLLAAALAVTDFLDSRTVQRPRELGSLMGQCCQSWAGSRPGLLPLVLGDIRVLRNSEAHRNTEIDVAAETITFVNHSPRRGRETVGPLDAMAFAGLLRSFLELCLAMEAALRTGVE